MKKQLFTALATLLVAAASADIPAGYYYKTDGLKKEALKSALNNIASNGIFLAYGGGAGYTWQGFYYTDRNETDSTVIDMYSNEKFKFTYTDGKPDFAAVEGMHIEHSLPKSWWGSVMYNSYKDLNHLFPAEGRINSAKNDLPLGIVGEATSDNGVSKVGKNTFRTADYAGNCFEPADIYKGDFARAYFYMATVYEEFADIWQSPMMDNNTYPVWKDWALELLLQWHRADPVSQKERDRQEAVYAIQGNRNPFIDYPELVEYIWGDKTDETFAAPADKRPFLVSPTRWDRFNFGVLMEGDNQSATFIVEGINLTADVQLKVKNSTPAFALSKTRITANEALQGDAEVTLTFSAVEIGEYADTIQISGGGLAEAINIPIKASVTDEFMVLEPTDITATAATLGWMRKADAANYHIDLYTGGEQASDLFFSAYIEGSSFNKAIAIYNGTGKAVDLSHYELRKQNNGVGSFKGDSLLQLSGTLPNNTVYVLAHKGASADLQKLADKICGADAKDEKTLLSFNGNDAIALYHSGIRIDVIGEIDNAQDWGKDVTLTRKPAVNGATTQFQWEEWDSHPTDYITDIDRHTMTGVPAEYIFQDKPVGNRIATRASNLTPNTTYTYRITAVGAAQTPTVNAVRFRTDMMTPPLALDPDNIEGDAFEPLWESVPGVQKYLIDVYQLSGPGFHTYDEGFDSLTIQKSVLETAGWRLTTTGNSIAVAACGVDTPSVAFKNEKDSLISPQFTYAARRLSFMYRWGYKKAKGNGDTIATLTLDAYNGSQWINIDTLYADSTTTQKYPVYTFPREANYTQFRWIYTRKVYGSVTLDDVSATYGYQDTTVVLRDEPWYEGWWVDKLDKNTDYYYRLRATSHDYVTDYSNEIKVTTNDIVEHEEHTNIVPEPQPEEPEIEVHTAQIHDDAVVIWANAGGIGIAGLPANSIVSIYDISGRRLYRQAHTGGIHFVPLTTHGIFIVHTTTNNSRQVYKIAK
ncbi:MAG: endonuclease [Paludibacteraceae bacterium]